MVQPKVKYVARCYILRHKLIGCVKLPEGKKGGGKEGRGNCSELLSIVEYYGHRSFGYMQIHMISRIAVLDQHEVVMELGMGIVGDTHWQHQHSGMVGHGHTTLVFCRLQKSNEWGLTILTASLHTIFPRSDAALE